MTALAPTVRHRGTRWFNLRALPDFSPTALLAESAGEREGLREFLRSYGVEAVLDHQADPLVKLQAFLARPNGIAPSRFSDGSFPVVYVADDERTNLAEVGYHLARHLAETEADATRTHYFLLAGFRLNGTALDVRRGFPHLHRPDDWNPAQAFGGRAWSEGAAGITYRSVRRRPGLNVAVFRSGLVQTGARVRLIGLRWNGTTLVEVRPGAGYFSAASAAS